jgi:hypothetical protein
VLADNGVEATPLSPANAGVMVAWSEHIRERFAGAPLKRLAVSWDGVTRTGEAVITQSGLEGGVIYQFSRALREALQRGVRPVLLLDLRPGLAISQIEARLRAGQGKQSVANLLRKAAGLAPAHTALIREPGRGTLPRDPAELARLIKALPLEVCGLAGLERAISTAGGVPFDALDDHFMLKARPGVFAAGEMLDWEAPTGGYLLQGSFATGVAAARGITAWLEGKPPPAR